MWSCQSNYGYCCFWLRFYYVKLWEFKERSIRFLRNIFPLVKISMTGSTFPKFFLNKSLEQVEHLPQFHQVNAIICAILGISVQCHL